MAIYALGATKHKVDIYFELCEQPRMFEWNYMHHWALEYCCMDIDGVVCEDPALFQNDDGKKYLDFIENAPIKDELYKAFCKDFIVARKKLILDKAYSVLSSPMVGV